MIPVRLTLQDFLCYPRAVLDLSGIHTACICGPNGAGKSALLDALTWGIWGQSRASNDSDLIRKGASQTQVEVIYLSRGQTYRILRSRHLSGQGSLEWQIQTLEGSCKTRWRTLTRRGMRATQQAIQSQLSLNYDTFIHSAYLRQGQADAFTLKRPGERKQILAEMLKLGQYDPLAERCREQMRGAKLKADLLQEHLHKLDQQQAQAEQIQAELTQLQHQQAYLQQLQTQQQQELQTLEHRCEQRRTLQDRHQHLTQHLHKLSATLQHTEQQWRTQRQHVLELESLLAQRESILAGYEHYQILIAQDRHLNHLFEQQQHLLEERQRLQAQQAEHQQQHLHTLQRLQQELANRQAQAQADAQLLAEQDRIETALQNYHSAQERLQTLSQHQQQAATLLEQQRQYQEQIHREQERLQARAQLLRQQLQAQHTQAQRQQQIQQALAAGEAKLAQLERRRLYQQRVLEKGQERRLFVQQLQERQRALQQQWQQEEERCWLLQDPLALGQDSAAHVLAGVSAVVEPETERDPDGEPASEFPLPQGSATERASGTGSGGASPSICPLCTRPLSPRLRDVVLKKHRDHQEDIAGELFVIREQLAVADREIELLREEYRLLSQELATADECLQAQGRLQQQWQVEQERHRQMEAWQAELAELEQILANKSYAETAHQHLQTVEQALQQLGYDDREYALQRGEVERWRWALGRSHDLRKAQERHPHLSEQIRALQAQLETLQQTGSPTSAVAERLAQIEQALNHLGYDGVLHQRLKAELTQAQMWPARLQALELACQELPEAEARSQALSQRLQESRQHFAQVTQELEQIHQQLAEYPSVSEAHRQGIRRAIQEHRQQLDQVLSQLGATQQRLEQVAQRETERVEIEQQLQQARRQQQVYQELANAYGRNGIPALIIENVLPELEAQANQILSRLTQHRLHLQFITQRSGRRSTKLIDTLDILIADPHGTRPYETYSGGEAFRINFAIRLALSRLLTQRSGSDLQTLLIDEGFGSQDASGRAQLLAAINAVAPEFACILVITHIPSLQDAFSHRIEVHPSPQGSRLQIRG
ncbi:SMC family ATPase [Synechococcus sp. Nb3U1]|uniref:SbcC/MukB-like Walker B domain-containing protein n=1 Tax=Synechococcus sp. Nb3U1 TaxID=1914529 RepID=UPI001F24FE3D|nr:SMC family ATPase [Synechococcus sp. Nb3U1]MCF2970482.1 SMC family ATPase [Synechococcus sp. Nb3U1]